MISVLVNSFSVLVIGCHPNFESIEFKVAYVKRKLMLINYHSRSFLFSDEFLSLRGRFYFIKEIKKTCSSCIVELYKHAGIFRTLLRLGAFYVINVCELQMETFQY